MQKLKSENPDVPMVMFLNYNIISLMMIWIIYYAINAQIKLILRMVTGIAPHAVMINAIDVLKSWIIIHHLLIPDQIINKHSIQQCSTIFLPIKI